MLFIAIWYKRYWFHTYVYITFCYNLKINLHLPICPNEVYVNFSKKLFNTYFFLTQAFIVCSMGSGNSVAQEYMGLFDMQSIKDRIIITNATGGFLLKILLTLI